MRKVLLIKTLDDRLFFTDVSNFPQLIEFGKAFGTEISVVNTEDKVEILPLPKLAKLFCNAGYRPKASEYDIVERKLGFNGSYETTENSAKRSRAKILRQAKEVREYIEKTLLLGEVLSLSKLSELFRDLTSQALRNHINYVKDKLAMSHKVFKCGVGCYKAEGH